MLAVRKTARGVGNIEVKDVPEPRPGPGQVVIEGQSSGSCGTELATHLDEFETLSPVTIGNDTAGIIVELGPEVNGWAVGDRVTTETYFYTCGECRSCRQ